MTVEGGEAVFEVNPVTREERYVTRMGRAGRHWLKSRLIDELTIAWDQGRLPKTLARPSPHLWMSADHSRGLDWVWFARAQSHSQWHGWGKVVWERRARRRDLLGFAAWPRTF